MLAKMLCASDMAKADDVIHSYASNCHFYKKSSILQRTKIICTMQCLVSSGILKLATDESITGSKPTTFGTCLAERWCRWSEKHFTAYRLCRKTTCYQRKQFLENIIPMFCSVFEQKICHLL